MNRFLRLLAVVVLVLSTGGLLNASAPISGVAASQEQASLLSNSSQPSNEPTSAEYEPYLLAADARPLTTLSNLNPQPMYNIEAEKKQSGGPYRTRITIGGVADLERLQKMNVPILWAVEHDAIVLADRLQLEQLAKLQFSPRDTSTVANLRGLNGAPLSLSASAGEILGAHTLDGDNDGLNDTEEGYWCTNANNPDSDNDTVSDGTEVQRLRDWVRHVPPATRSATGKPFPGWPPDHTGCYDSDYDSVPDAVEVYVFGLNPNRESTPRDKFDDGQKLFGLTNCPGIGGGCGYGALPRLVDWEGGLIFAEMPSWVRAPYDGPFVAAFPVPDVAVVPSSLVVTARTTIQTERTITNGEAHTYGTSDTRGTSTSNADTTTWNQWQEVSNTTRTGMGSQEGRKFNLVNPSSHGSSHRVTGSELTFLASGVALAACVFAEPCGALVFAGLGLAAIGSGFTLLGEYEDQGHGQGPGDGKQSIPACFPPPQQFSCREQASFRPPTSNERVGSQNSNTSSQNRTGLDNTQYSVNPQGRVQSQRAMQPSYPISNFVPTTTTSHGSEVGGAHTTTHTSYEEHTISQSSTKQFSEAWSNATALNTTEAAELRFTYHISNQGSDYARQISGIAFNIYIGDDPNPIATYFPAADIGGGGVFSNFMPGETHTYSTNTNNNNPIYLTLDEMRRVDLGESIFIVVEDFSYGNDELFYEDAINSGISFVIDNGDGILHDYVLPTWGSETVQEVAERFFPSTADDNNDLLSLSIPDFSTQPITWESHELNDSSWWNLYLENLGDGSALFKDTSAAADSIVLIRMNSDSDYDGYNDRNEVAFGTDPNDPSSHPYPQLIAATRSTRVGNVVSSTLTLLNTGTYDAYGIEAVMYAPTLTTTIGNNVVGGSGRVKAGSQVVLGSRIYPPGLSNWTGGKPFTSGSYAGSVDDVFTFTARQAGVIGSGTVNIDWASSRGITGTIPLSAFGAGYDAPLPVPITGTNGVQIGFDTGPIRASETFTVAVELPRDTFTYTVPISPTSFITPVVVVSYNDPQGSHKFVTPVEVTDCGSNLISCADEMLGGVGVDIVAIDAFNQNMTNTVNLVANSPHPLPVNNGHLVVDFVDDEGTVVYERVYTQTLQSGPNVLPVDFHVSSFDPAYQPGEEYLLMAFFTDAQGNIIDSHGRLLSTFAADPHPILNTAPAAWNFVTVVQGDLPQRTISIVNTGLMPLNAVISAPTSPTYTLTLSGANGIISVPPAGTREITATLDTTLTPPGAVNIPLTIRSNDTANQSRQLLVTGTVISPTLQAHAFDIQNRPWDERVRVYGNVQQNTTVTFTHGIQPDAESIEPCKIFAADGVTLEGVGMYCTGFSSGSVAYHDLFGDGRDGNITISSNTTDAPIDSAAIGAIGSTSLSATNPLFTPGQVVMIHQSRGTGAGTWMLNRIAGYSPGAITVQKPITATFASGAQVVVLKQYANVTVNPSVTWTAKPWNGTTGGILAFLANGLVTINGTINAAGNNGTTIDVNASTFGGGATGTGFKGGNAYGNTTDITTLSEQGEGTSGAPSRSTSANGNGGGGARGIGPGGGNWNGAGGGGHVTAGVAGPQQNGGTGGAGGETAGSNDLTNIVFGGAGGGGVIAGSGLAGGGGAGGGIVMISAKTVTISGSINLNGGLGGNGGNLCVGGGGAGGSALIRSEIATLGTNSVTSMGGSGGTSGNPPWAGANVGGNGRVRVEYCDSFSGSTNPPASTQKLTCHIAEKVGASNVRYTVPDAITGGQNYIMEFGRRYPFTVGVNTIIADTRFISQTYASATMDALISNVGAGGPPTMTLGIGIDNQPAFYTATMTVTQSISLTIPSFHLALNAYIEQQVPSQTIDVPIRVTMNRQADVMLTKLRVTPGLGIDLAVGPGDITIGCPGAPGCLATEGNVVTTTVQIHNDGAQPAYSAVVGYYAGDPTAGGRLLGNSYVETIEPGGTATATFGWSTEGFRGQQVLYAYVDPSGSINEVSRANNITSQPLYIKTKPDLRVPDVDYDNTGPVEGEPINATFTVSNTGETNAVTSTGRLQVVPERVGGTVFTQTLPTGSVVATDTVNVSSIFTPTVFGTHNITFTADVGSTVTESVETNNVLTSTIYVGRNLTEVDAGATSDPAYAVYSPTLGYGYLNGSSYDFGGNTITSTVRYDGSGQVQYQFDGMQPTRPYHLDGIFYQQGDVSVFTQTLLFDDVDSGQVIPMNYGSASNASILVPAAAYTDKTMLVTVRRPGSYGPAFVSELVLRPVEYTYIDAGSASDLAYDTQRGYGYLDTNTTYISTLGGNEPVNTYRTAFGNTVRYQFDNLTSSKNYAIDLTLFDGSVSTRLQSVLVDGVPIAACTNLTVNTGRPVKCPVNPSHYSDGRVIVSVVCSNCTGPRVNEIALHEQTLSLIEPGPSPTPTATTTPVPGVQTSIGSFSAQWSGSMIRVNWSTLRENRTDTFHLLRSSTINPPAWTEVHTPPSISNCALDNNPHTYPEYQDQGVIAGQAYYYRLTWSGDSCGGQWGEHPTQILADPYQLRGHVDWQGRPGQPNILHQLPITFTLSSGANVYTYTNMATDASGYFTVSVRLAPQGIYNWRAKGPQYLAKSGSVTLAGDAVTQQEIGLMVTGDANDDNVVDITDFGILRLTFGRSQGDPDYDPRADFNGDTIVDITDFGLLRGNFGQSGTSPFGPAGPHEGSPIASTPGASTGSAYLELRPKADAPANGGKVQVGDSFVLELWLNGNSQSDLIGQQSYLTVTHELLQNVEIAAAGPRCMPASSISPNVTVFDIVMQNEACNGPDPCVDRGIKTMPGSIGFASAISPGSSNTGSGAFKVGEIGLCALAPGEARLHWQFAPPDPASRNTGILDQTGRMVHDISRFSDYLVQVVTDSR